MVNIEYYKTFLTVARCKNLTKASEILNISQPAVTKTIKQLESQIGGKLFIRSKNGMTLTKEGEEVFNKVNFAMNILKDVENDFVKKETLQSGEIRIGISTILSEIYLLPFIKEFKDKYPNVKLDIQNGLTLDLLHMLKKGSLDLVIFNDTVEEDKILNFRKIKEIEYKFAYNENFYDIKTINDLNNKNFVVQKNKSFTRKLFNDFVDKNNLKINESIEVTSHLLGYELIKQGLGIGLVYKDLIKESFVKEAPINLKTNLYVATNKNICQTTATKVFNDLLR